MKTLLTFFSTSTGDREEALVVCAGKEFRLPVYSISRTVTFTPDPPGMRRVLLEKTIVSGSVSMSSCLCLSVVHTYRQHLTYCPAAGKGPTVRMDQR